MPVEQRLFICNKKQKFNYTIMEIIENILSLAAVFLILKICLFFSSTRDTKKHHCNHEENYLKYLLHEHRGFKTILHNECSNCGKIISKVI